MISGDDVLSGSDESTNFPKGPDNLTAVDLRLDDELADAGAPAKLAFSVAPEEANLGRVLTEASKINIVINQFEKKGEGINAFIVYRIVTTTENVLGYANREYEVWRRFSDFLGLHEKLMEKYFQKGILVAAAPEKSLAAFTKTKMNSGPDEQTNKEFAERRARALQRFCMRIARHPKLVSDCDFRDFLTLAAPLPKANSTAALSGAGVKRMFKSVGDVFSKMAYHMDENDRWFESAQTQMDDLEQMLNRLLRAVETIASYRRELAVSSESFSKALSMLASCEENTALARALSHLTEAYENVAQQYVIQADRDTALLTEVIHEQLQIIVTLKELFFERVKVWQNWQAAQQNLSKKKELKARYELAGRADRANQAKEEVTNAERQVDEVEREFAEVSKVIRGEYERHLGERRVDLHNMFVQYLEGLLDTQKKVLQHWERFAPETRAIVIA
uniref:PX domain-containing protein n=1 Tax=Parascaris univalens TaxID=6257 RepID=A0A915ALT4_PARUN